MVSAPAGIFGISPRLREAACSFGNRARRARSRVLRAGGLQVRLRRHRQARRYTLRTCGEREWCPRPLRGACAKRRVCGKHGAGSPAAGAAAELAFVDGRGAVAGRAARIVHRAGVPRHDLDGLAPWRHVGVAERRRMSGEGRDFLKREPARLETPRAPAAEKFGLHKRLGARSSEPWGNGRQGVLCIVG